MENFVEVVEEINKHLACVNQNWLFGAGISFGANIPLMRCLTRRVLTMLTDTDIVPLVEDVIADLPADFHIEHILSHLVDLIAIAERSKHKAAEINGRSYGISVLSKLHLQIISAISTTVRYGYCEANAAIGSLEQIGRVDEPIVILNSHREFAKTLMSMHANLMSRSTITIFTTNYDTLLEDAFSLQDVEVNDGFVGSAIGNWHPEASYNKSKGINIVKLHGSVDWVKDERHGLIRTRYGVGYIPNDSDVLIYPQATKYVETQKDPFATLFSEFRSKLGNPNDNVLIICGYSFGDGHINSELYQAINHKNNKTTIIAFVEEMNDFLTSLVRSDNTSNKLFVMTRKGLYHGDETLISPTVTSELECWKFDKLITFLKDGEAL